MRLKSLQIKNFRSLKDFRVEKLGHVNLIVGKNNSGKSSVLEALRIYAGGASRTLLETIAAEHDERISRIADHEKFDENTTLPFQHFFSGRCFPEKEGDAISIGEVGNYDSAVLIQRTYLLEEEEIINSEDVDPRVRINRRAVTRTEAEADPANVFEHGYLVATPSRSFYIRPEKEITSNRSADGKGLFPYSYIPTRFISLEELAEIWDGIVFTPFEEFVKEALRIVSPDFENIVFVTAEDSSLNRLSRMRTKRSAKVKMKNMDTPISLNSLGDGMLRVLQLVLNVYPARGGMLLIDEFENGLHYSVQKEVWRLLFALAKEMDIQIFATTHSWDCVESFSQIAIEEKKVDGVLFRVGRSLLTSSFGTTIATVFDEEKLAALTQADVEVR